MSPLWLGALAMGFAGSGHCGVMCGGIASSAASAPRGRRAVLGFSLNAGRVLTYGMAGALVGGLGSMLDDLSGVRGFLVPLRGVLGIALVVLGLGLATGVGSFALLDRLGAPLWNLLRPYAMRLSGPRSPVHALLFGALWGFLPCGLVYAALGVAAASGSAARGAMVMLAFGAGTLPALLLLGSLAARLRTLLSRAPMRAAVGLVVAFSGFVNVTSAWPTAGAMVPLGEVVHACCHAPRSR